MMLVFFSAYNSDLALGSPQNLDLNPVPLRIDTDLRSS